jgi:pimeloyl-ACP methyl ester carboxylesterase
MTEDRDVPITLGSVEIGPPEGDAETVRLHTDDGLIDTRYHDAGTGDTAVLWVFGSGGGLDGPAGGLDPRLAERLAPKGIASLRLDYRSPGELIPCVLDVVMGIGYLGTRGRSRVILVGHSFGGIVVIAAAGVCREVIAVAALSSQTAGAAAVGRIAPRPLLLMHGTDDDVLPDRCSRELYRLAGEPRSLKLYEGCGHGLDECRQAVETDLLTWILEVPAA